MKKKLDFYLATGNLPLVAKNGLQNGSTDIGKMASMNNIDRSCRGSDDTDLASSKITDGCKVEEVGKDLLEIASLFPDTRASTSAPHAKSSDSEVVTHEAQSLQINPLQSFPNVDAVFDKSRTSDKSCQYRVIETPMSSEIPEYGTLYYEPPLLEKYVPLGSDLQNICGVQHYSDSSPKMSPVTFSTPLSVSSSSLCTQTPESILKIAAKSFQHTPSILRKRKTKSQLSTPSNKVGKAEEGNKDRSLASDECGQINGFRRSEMQDRSLDESPESDNNGKCTGKSFNASPPYRLRSKRTTVLKPVEKQLKFACNEEQHDNDANLDSSTVKEVSSAKNNLEMAKMVVT